MRQEDLPGSPLIVHYGHSPCSCSYGMYVARLTQPSTTTPVKADELCRRSLFTQRMSLARFST
ncbi:hypothetical protein M404DRAFT_256825 [Pisolithus tinctorius Marx 270]|uniref:Uncharacterized protein n=1 Tax=Pisolithus tinctorius Marx 270 TaxID=870435 RepID=A0A0C3NLD0_PISTI|nr:hypothetical protein M404DRAFT_256825 [Pisolithus tinctorius Marx 270]